MSNLEFNVFLKKIKGYLYLYFLYGNLANYESLINNIEREGIMGLPGDLIEVGSFIGGGTKKLARYAKQFKKKVYAIDIFDPLVDLTTYEKGTSMADIYVDHLAKIGLTMFKAYWFNVGRCSNVITIPKDSRNIKFSPHQLFCFGFVDGNHSSEYVTNDFYLVWMDLVPGGIIAFHDYGSDILCVTKTINEIIEKHKEEIRKLIINPVNHVIYIKKRAN